MTCSRRTLAEGVQRVASRAILGLLLTTVLAASGCSPLGDGLDRTIRRVTDGYRFSFLRWEVDHLIRKGRLTPEGAVEYRFFDYRRSAVETEQDGFFLRITGHGDWRYQGADLGIPLQFDNFRD